MEKKDKSLFLFLTLSYGSITSPMLQPAFKARHAIRNFPAITKCNYHGNFPDKAIDNHIQTKWATKIDPSIDIRKIAWLSQQFSETQIDNCLKQAEKFAAEQNQPKILLPHVYEAFAYLLHGPQKSPSSTYCQKKVAAHEWGHVLTELAYPADHVIIRATIQPREKFEGSTMRMNCFNHGFNPPTKLTLNAMRSRLGGSIAEQVLGMNGSKKMITTPQELNDFLESRTAENDTVKFIEYLSEISNKHALTQEQSIKLALELTQDVHIFLDNNQSYLKAGADLLEKEKTIYEDTIYTIIPGIQKPKYYFEK